MNNEYGLEIGQDELILGEGNMNNNPLFEDMENYDFTLTDNSPCIDAGIGFYEFDEDTILNLTSGESKNLIPKISIITSVYNGDEFIESFLEDITEQTIFKDKCELIMVNANSPGNEGEIINKYIEKYPENI